jgi:hypothetical protein
MNGERCNSFLLLSVCLSSESQKSKRVSVVFVLSRSFVFFSERLLFWTTREAKKASERERRRERTPRKTDRQTDRQKDPGQKDREF